MVEFVHPLVSEGEMRTDPASTREGRKTFLEKYSQGVLNGDVEGMDAGVRKKMLKCRVKYDKLSAELLKLNDDVHLYQHQRRLELLNAYKKDYSTTDTILKAINSLVDDLD